MNTHQELEIAELQEALVEFKIELPINSMELDEECRRQPEKYEMVGQLATTAKALARGAKDTLDFVEAELKSKVRKEPESFGLTGKVTNDAVNETVTIHSDFQEAKRNYIEISKIADGFSILVSSMEQRKNMLQNLVSLYTHKYYANQSLSGEEKSLDKAFEEEVAEERGRDEEG